VPVGHQLAKKFVDSIVLRATACRGSVERLIAGRIYSRNDRGDRAAIASISSLVLQLAACAAAAAAAQIEVDKVVIRRLGIVLIARRRV